MGSTEDPRLLWNNHIPPPACLWVRPDLPEKCTQHHNSPEQSLTSSSIRGMSYQAKKPPTVPMTYRERSGHLTNPHSSPTGGWLLLSKRGAMTLLSQNHQPPPLTQQNKPKQGNSPLQHNILGGKWQDFPKHDQSPFPLLSGDGSTLLAVQPEASTESLPLQPPCT